MSLFIYLFIFDSFKYVVNMPYYTAPTHEMTDYLWFNNVVLEAVVAYFEFCPGICL